MRLTILGLALFIISCSQEESFLVDENHITNNCTLVETRTLSGVVVDYYTGEPVPDARLIALDFTPGAQGLIVEDADDLGMFEFQANLCAGEEFFNRLEITHDDYDASHTFNSNTQSDLVIKMYRTIKLKVNLKELDRSDIGDLSLKFSYAFDDERYGKSVGATSGIFDNSFEVELPESIDIKFSYTVNGQRSETQILNLSEDDEIDITYR